MYASWGQNVEELKNLYNVLKEELRMQRINNDEVFFENIPFMDRILCQKVRADLVEKFILI